MKQSVKLSLVILAVFGATSKEACGDHGTSGVGSADTQETQEVSSEPPGAATTEWYYKCEMGYQHHAWFYKGSNLKIKTSLECSSWSRFSNLCGMVVTEDGQEVECNSANTGKWAKTK